MRNRFEGICYRCGEIVKVGEGHFEKRVEDGPGLRWRTQHAECAIAYRGTSLTGERPATRAEAMAVNERLHGDPSRST